MIKEKVKEIHDFKIFDMPRSTESDISKIINAINTKSSQGFDKIPPKIIKMCANKISKPISNIVNASIDMSTFVNTAKISLCTPL